MKTTVIDTKGNKVEEISLKDDVFGIEPNLEALAQYLRVYLFNQRQGTSSAKTRAEVSGGGVKPWRQKGTGRARHGSTRSPIWAHGGVTHGPKPKSWNLSISDKIKKLAFKSALSQKFAEKKAVIISAFDFAKPSTKTMAEILKKLDLNGKTLIIWNKKDENLVKSCGNIQDLEIKFVGTLNAFDLVWAKNVVFLKDAVLVVEETYKK